MATASRARSSRGAGGADVAAPGVDRFAAASGAARQRRWSLALVSLLVTVASALAFVVLWLNAGTRRPYLVVTRDVPAGGQITAADLDVVRVSLDGRLRPIPAAQRSQVIGQTARVELGAGSMLTVGVLGKPDETATAGKARVALPLTATQVYDRFRAGDQVAIVDTSVGSAVAVAVVESVRTVNAADGAYVATLVLEPDSAGLVLKLVKSGSVGVYALPKDAGGVTVKGSGG